MPTHGVDVVSTTLPPSSPPSTPSSPMAASRPKSPPLTQLRKSPRARIPSSRYDTVPSHFVTKLTTIPSSPTPKRTRTSPEKKVAENESAEDRAEAKEGATAPVAGNGGGGDTHAKAAGDNSHDKRKDVGNARTQNRPRSLIENSSTSRPHHAEESKDLIVDTTTLPNGTAVTDQWTSKRPPAHRVLQPQAQTRSQSPSASPRLVSPILPVARPHFPGSSRVSPPDVVGDVTASKEEVMAAQALLKSQTREGKTTSGSTTRRPPVTTPQVAKGRSGSHSSSNRPQRPARSSSITPYHAPPSSSSSHHRLPSLPVNIPPAANNLRPGDTITFPDKPDVHGCPYCNKVYTGQHARSICRRHQMSKHGIELEVQVKKSRWDNNPNRPATEAEKHKRTLESKRRWAAKDRRRRRAAKLGIRVEDLEDDDDGYSDEDGSASGARRDQVSPSQSMSQEPELRERSESYQPPGSYRRPQRMYESDEDEEQEMDDRKPSHLAQAIHGTPVSQLRSGGAPGGLGRYHAGDETSQPGSSNKHRSLPSSAARLTARAASPASSSASSIQRGRADSVTAGSDTASLPSGHEARNRHVQTTTSRDSHGRSIYTVGGATRNSDGSASYSDMALLGNQKELSQQRGHKRAATANRPGLAKRRQSSMSTIPPPVGVDHDSVFGVGKPGEQPQPITPSKKRTQMGRRESSDSDEEAAKVLLAISASPARPPTDATPVPLHRTSDAPPRLPPCSTFVSADEGFSLRLPRFNEVPGAVALTQDETTPVRPYNGLSLGAHGRRVGESTPGSAGGLWPAQVRRRSVSERVTGGLEDDPFQPPSLHRSSQYHPSSSVSRRAMDSEPQTPGELYPPVEIMPYQETAGTPSLYGTDAASARPDTREHDSILSSPLSYPKPVLPPGSLPQTSSLRSATGYNTLSAAARLTTPARTSAMPPPPTTDRRGGDMTSPAVFNPFSSPSGLDITHKLGLAPAAMLPESPGWLAMVRETPKPAAAGKRRASGLNSSDNEGGEEEGDEDDGPLLMHGREAKRSRFG